MALNNGAYLVDTWPELKANPVFRRAMIPRGLRWVARSPLPRALVLTMVALAAYEALWRLTLSIPVAIASAVVFWFLVHFVQRAFCWVELNTLARTGNLADYLNSGLSRADVAMGVIFPAVISEIVAVAGLMLWFLVSDPENTFLLLLLAFVLFLQVRRLFSPPEVFLPDVESYVRRPGPMALFSVGLAALVPLVLWFAIYYAAIFAIIFGLAAAGVSLDRGLNVVLAFAATWWVAGWLIRQWQYWRLKRFYARNESFESLFDQFLEAKGE